MATTISCEVMRGGGAMPRATINGQQFIECDVLRGGGRSPDAKIGSKAQVLNVKSWSPDQDDTEIPHGHSVEVNVENGTLAVTFNDLVIDGETINGTAVVTASQEGMVITLETDINVTFSTDGYAVTYIGDVTAEINLDTGEMVISQADLEAIDDTGDTYGIILDDVHIVLVEILPYSGTATIILGTEDEFPLTVVVRFTEDTPTDGTVYVSVNGSPEVRMSLEDVEVEQ